MTGGWLEGRRALVVGAGSGIGRAVVDTFLAEGARVAVLERDPDKCRALRTEQPGVPVTAGDATSQEANEAAVAAAVQAFGGLDLLVNCVGIFDFYRSVVDLDPTSSRPPSTRSSTPTCCPTCGRCRPRCRTCRPPATGWSC